MSAVTRFFGRPDGSGSVRMRRRRGSRGPGPLRSRLFAAVLFVLAVLFLLSEALFAQTGSSAPWTVLGDHDFVEGAWATQVLEQEPGATFEVRRLGEGGNGDGFRRTSHTLPQVVDRKGIEVLHLYAFESYSPERDGPIGAVSFSADVRNVTGSINGRFVLAQRNGEGVALCHRGSCRTGCRRRSIPAPAEDRYRVLPARHTLAKPLCGAGDESVPVPGAARGGIRSLVDTLRSRWPGCAQPASGW